MQYAGIRTPFVVTMAMALAPSGWATAVHAEPIAVSPGSQSRAERLADSCPTFSWAGVEGAMSYELILYRVGDDEILQTVLQNRIPGGARGWTPAAAECPEPGTRHAWAVRATTADGVGQWSEPLLFETPGAPTNEEIRRAIEVLDRHRQAGAAADPVAIESEKTTSNKSRPRWHHETTTVTGEGSGGFGVDGAGNVQATSFAGDGSGLSGVNASALQGNSPSDFAPVSHTHAAGAITSGVLADARIPSGITRDSELFGHFLPLAGGGTVTGSLGLTTAAHNAIPQAPVHLATMDINLNSGLLGEDVLIEANDAVLGIYSSSDGNIGSAITLGESQVTSTFVSNKWAIFRETSNGGRDLRFTFGNDSNYVLNDQILELRDDGTTHGHFVGPGAAKVAGEIDFNGTLLKATPAGAVASVTLNNDDTFTVKLASGLVSCSNMTVLVTPRGLISSPNVADAQACPFGVANTFGVRIWELNGSTWEVDNRRFAFVVF